VLRLCASVVLAALALAGCGSSSPSPKDAYIGKLDPVCAKFAKRLEPDRQALHAAIAGHDSARIAAALNRSARDLALEYNRLNDFRPPHAELPRIQRMLHALEAEALITGEYAAAVATPGPSETGALVEEIHADATEARRIARHYGFRACGATG
jgi:hypothetical protein